MADNRIITVPREEIVFSKHTLEKLDEYCGEDDDLKEEWRRIVKEAVDHSFPKGMYSILPLTITDGVTDIDGKVTKNAFVAEHLGEAGIHRVFPYIATAGVELLEWSKTVTDPILAYMLDQLMNAVVGIAAMKTTQAIKNEFHIEGHFSSLSPGSVSSWTTSQGQPYLFDLLGGQPLVKETIGVTLTETMLMLPRKTVSSIGFETGEHNFQMCTYCSMPDCPNRRAKSSVGIREKTAHKED